MEVLLKDIPLSKAALITQEEMVTQVKKRGQRESLRALFVLERLDNELRREVGSGGRMIDIYSQDEVGRWVQSLIDVNNIHAFYVSGYWLNLRADVLDEYKHECQRHKDLGYYERADTVHHVQYVRKHPRLALSKTYIFQGKEIRNLVPLCHNCHEIVHDYRKKKIEKPLTEERW